MENSIIITDCSLRDGNHAVKHQIELSSIERYCKFAEEARVPIVEVGHGNGLGASSILIGQSKYTDYEMLKTAKENLKRTRLGVHVIPGIATVKKDIIPAMELGVDVFRIACHVTEATVTKSHIKFLSSEFARDPKYNKRQVFGVLMMSALANIQELVDNAKRLEEYGATAVIIMDSTGAYNYEEVFNRISHLKDGLSIDIGFHAHNNLGLAVANSIEAVKAGATYIDACIRGFGAGAGNAPLELVVPALKNKTNVLFDEVIKEADKATDYLVPQIPTPNPVNILTGLSNLFSGFEKPIIKASKMYGIEYSSLIFELGNRKLVAGQEDLILEVAQKLKNEKENTGNRI